MSVDDGRFTLSPDNYARYAPFVRMVRSLDVEQAMGVYTRYYPLLQQAYEELGYPSRQFNDRVIQVIDDLLNAPQPRQPIDLVRVKDKPHLIYEINDTRPNPYMVEFHTRALAFASRQGCDQTVHLTADDAGAIGLDRADQGRGGW